MTDSVESSEARKGFSLLETLSANSLRENCTLPSFVSVQGPGIAYVGLSKFIVSKDQYAWQLLVRPDVLEEALLNLTEQILLSSCGAVNRLGPNNAAHSVPIAEGKEKPVVYYSSILESVHDETANIAGSTGPSLWTSIRVYLGVSAHFDRVLLLHITPSPDVTAMSSLLTTRRSQFAEFCDSILQALSLALDVESLSLNHLSGEETVVAFDNGTLVNNAADNLLNMSLVDDNSSTFSGGSTNSTVLRDRARYYPSPLTPLESIIDVSFVRDLQASFAQLLLLRLTTLGEQLDPEVKNMELQCARLMSLLRPSYTRAVLAIPTAPPTKSLSSYPLTLDRKTILEPQEEDSKFLLLKARRRLKQHNSSGGSHNMSLAEEINLLIGFLHEQLSDWMEVELQRRTDRKLLAVKDRLQTVHQFKMRLVLSLHERFNISPEDTSQYTFGAFNQDRAVQATVQEKFKFIDSSEPLLLDCSAALNSRSGTVYFTIGHILFYSMGVLVSSVMAVIPLHTIATMNVVLGGKVTATFQYLDPPAGKEQPSLSGGDGICILDSGGQEHLLDLKGLTPDYNKRVVDLLDVLIKEKLYLLRNNSPIANNKYSANSTAAASIQHSTVSAQSYYENQYNVDDLLELIGAPPAAPPVAPASSSSSGGAAATGSAPIEVKSKSSFSVSVEGGAGSDIASSVGRDSTVSSPTDSISSSTAAPTTATTAAAGTAEPVQPRGKARSANIKKFLEKSQNQNKSSPPPPPA